MFQGRTSISRSKKMLAVFAAAAVTGTVFIGAGQMGTANAAVAVYKGCANPAKYKVINGKTVAHYQTKAGAAGIPCTEAQVLAAGGKPGTGKDATVSAPVKPVAQRTPIAAPAATAASPAAKPIAASSAFNVDANAKHLYDSFAVTIARPAGKTSVGACANGYLPTAGTQKQCTKVDWATFLGGYRAQPLATQKQLSYNAFPDSVNRKGRDRTATGCPKNYGGSGTDCVKVPLANFVF